MSSHRLIYIFGAFTLVQGKVIFCVSSPILNTLWDNLSQKGFKTEAEGQKSNF